MTNFVAVTGDLVASRQIKGRAKVQKELQRINNEINKKFKKHLAVPFNFRGGDEVQGLVKELSSSIEIIYFYTKNLYPQNIRFGIGKGTISTTLADTTVQMDGECFARSRGALEKAKKGKRNVLYATGNLKFDVAINTIFLLMESLQKNWKSLHYRRFWLYRELGRIGKVAEKENISKQAVAKSLKTAHYDTLLEAEKNLKFLLSEENLSLSTP